MLYLIFICHPRVQYHCFTRLIKENNPKQKQIKTVYLTFCLQRATKIHCCTLWDFLMFGRDEGKVVVRRLNLAVGGVTNLAGDSVPHLCNL